MTASLPRNEAAERSILGACLVDARCLARVQAAGLHPVHFYRPDHGALFDLLGAMAIEGAATDLVTVPERVLRSGRPERYGGAVYVAQLSDGVPSTANVEHYAELVIEDWRRRELIAALERAREDAMAGALEVSALTDAFVQRVLRSADAGTGAGFRPMAAALDDALRQAEAASADPERHGGISTGFRDLDRLCRLHPHDLVVLASRPAMGKTALAVQIALAVARPRGTSERRNVALFSLEMPASSLALRTLGTRSGVSASSLRSGRGPAEGIVRARAAAPGLRRDLASVYVDDAPGLSVGAVVSRARALAQRVGPLALVVVDYLQLLGADLGPRASREREVANVSAGLKQLARDLNTSVLALAQLSRTCEARNDKRPLLSDLRDSGAIEQDSDAVWFVFRPAYYWPDKAEHTGKAEVIVAKQRNGPTGVVDLAYEAHLTEFRDLSIAQVTSGARPAAGRGSNHEWEQP